MLSLAKLYLSRNSFALAQNMCSTMLKTDAGDEEATLMIVRILFKQKQFSQAIKPLQELLNRKPDHWEALVLAIEAHRFSGTLRNGDIKSYFEVAERLLGGNKDTVDVDDVKVGHSVTKLETKASGKVTMQIGYQFCRGLFNRFVFLNMNCNIDFLLDTSIS